MALVNSNRSLRDHCSGYIILKASKGIIIAIIVIIMLHELLTRQSLKLRFSQRPYV